MNETLVHPASEPMPTTERRSSVVCHVEFSPDNRQVYLKPDCFGLANFMCPSELVAEPGDIVQIDRVLYSDWALYVGEGQVAHLSSMDEENNNNSLINSADSAVVKLSGLDEVAGVSGVRVNNKSVGAKERNLDSLPVPEVEENCRKCLGQEVDFNMLTRNSEHYVTEWKYGTAWSDQAAMTMSVMKALTVDCNRGHNVLVNGINAVLNSPGSPASRSPPTFPSCPISVEKRE